ncbi:hypothetical protein RHSIM_Rhsim04G0050400 [Rhododendron simsii]|uniref:ENTH domain-containing protein n=1 Tax=Rhododendron simsii TaxID=118357 RepID=A0A834LRR4_RHOSS|nr:hypothetical protein RHSIM_Rhsim04G0050400 [Rhododendron simsii]
MPSKLKKAIGAVKDQTSISLAKVTSNNSSNLEVAVLKATTHDVVPMDDRHVHEILRLVSSDKDNAALLARAIGKRIGRTRNWIVAVKSLMLVLRTFQDGDPYFPREVLLAMKRGAKILNLSSFRDDSNSSPWDYTAFVRTFALYLDERLECFLTGKLQRRYTHKNREPFHRRSRSGNEPVRDMKPAMLLDKISYWQRLLDRAVATRPTGAAKTNRLVQITLYAVVQESFDLYKDISDGLALLLDSFFHLQYNSCVNAFQSCVKATKQFEELSAFYDVCKSIGVGRTSEYPSVQKISEELIETLREFLKDHSSFPAVPSRPQLLLPGPSPMHRRRDRDSSGGQSEFSETTGRGSEFSCTSLEDLISATELTGTSRSISIDLEAYSIADQAEKVDDDGSTRSLPVTRSFVDLVSLDEMAEGGEGEVEREGEGEGEGKGKEESSSLLIDLWSFNEKDEQEKGKEGGGGDREVLDSGSTTGWEIVLAETATTSTQPLTNGFEFESFDPFSGPENDKYYNPFLDDATESTAIVTVPAADSGTGVGFSGNDGFSLGPTFQATPTFCAGNSSSTSLASVNENDPFASFPTGGGEGGFISGGSGNQQQQNLLLEQQLWLQQQNKIMARHMA